MNTFVSIAISLAAITFSAFADTRFEKPVTLHDYHPFRSYPDGQWDKRRSEIRLRTQVAAGLLPMPEKTPLNARRFGAIERDGFRVEKVYFESFPGHWVTGSLFTPLGESESLAVEDGKRPGILCPYGHWKGGRFYDARNMSGERTVENQLATGAERFESAARNPIIARCVQLARMGCIAFVYDMIGEGDSKQFAEHRRGPRSRMNGSEPGEFGFISPMATLRLQTNFGLQTWNSVRALDFLAGLDGVDPDRIGVTGASGGATQTMVLSAIDERVDAAFPCVMASTAMQGGCTCENTHYLRIGQGNIDIPAAIAPKPLGLTAADDWTIELESKGHPDLLALYEELGRPGHYEAHFDIHFKHNYNHVSRTHMYGFMNRHFGIGLDEPVLEKDFVFLGPDDLTVWPDDVRPDGYFLEEEHEKSLHAVWASDSDKQLDAALEKPRQSWLAEGWSVILRADQVRGTQAEFKLGEKKEDGGNVRMGGTISGNSSPFAASFIYPESWNGDVLIQLGDGAAEAAGDAAVVVPVLYGQGNEEERNDPTTYSGNSDRPEDSWQRSPVYFYGYNDSVFVRRVHDLVSTVAMVRQHPKWEVKKIVVEAEGSLAAVALAANFILGGGIDDLRVDPGEFRFANVGDNWSDDMVPGAVKYGDVEGLKALQPE